MATNQPMEVCEIGLHRTGTRTICVAFNLLGWSVNHGLIGRGELVQGLQRDFVRKALAGRCDFEAFNRYRYVGHLGAPWFKRIAEARPNCRFILTIRDMGAWLESHRNNVSARPWKKAVRQGMIDFHVVHRWSFLHALDYNEMALVERYNEHLTAVKEFFAHQPDRLLIFNVFAGDGWPKLCGWLGIPAPNVKWPNQRHRSTLLSTDTTAR
jgi:hypothetical protein